MSKELLVIPSWEESYQPQYKDYILSAFKKLDFLLERLDICWLTKEQLADKQLAKEQLDQWIEAYEPKAILLVGAIALELLTDEKGIDNFRLSDHRYKDVSLIACYSPAYLERGSKGGSTPEERYHVWLNDIADCCNIADKYYLTKSEFKLNTYKTISTIDEVKELIEYCKARETCSFDVEATGLSFWKHKIVTLAISFQFGSSYVIPIYHKDSPFNDDQIKEIFALLSRDVFNNPNIVKYGQNTQYDMGMIAYHGVKFSGLIHDLKTIVHLLDENRKGYGLKAIAAELYPETKGYELHLSSKEWEKLDEYNLEEICQYNALDTDLTLRCTVHYLDELVKDKELYNHYMKIDAPVLKCLFNMSRVGMLLDKDKMVANTQLCNDKLAEIDQLLRNFPQVKRFEMFKEKEVKEAALAELIIKRDKAKGRWVTTYNERIAEIQQGITKVYEGINLSSPSQLAKLLYSSEGFGFKKPIIDDKKSKGINKEASSKKESESTSKEVLINLNDSSGFVALLLELRSIEKVKSTYMVSLVEKLDANNYAHTDFNIIGTATGRLSSSKPNLQNIPRASKVGSLVKECFIAPHGYYMLQADLSQAELRIIAKLSGDTTMVNAYAKDLDLHTITAQRTLSVPVDKWNELDKDAKKAYRTSAKAINFGFVYGMSASSFGQYAKNNYGVVFTEEQSLTIRDSFFSTYSALILWHRRYKDLAKQHKYVKTMFGRKRRLPEIDSIYNGERSEAERQAINSPVQGTAGEYTLYCLIKLSEVLPKEVILVNTVHDSIIMYVPCEMIESVGRLVKDTMENLDTQTHFNFSLSPVGIKVDIEFGENWANLKELVLA